MLVHEVNSFYIRMVFQSHNRSTSVIFKCGKIPRHRVLCSNLNVILIFVSILSPGTVVPDSGKMKKLFNLSDPVDICIYYKWTHLFSWSVWKKSRSRTLTAKSSSRSGDRRSGIITWFRKDGVFSFLSSLLMVFNWPDRRAKLSSTVGLKAINQKSK